MTIKPELMETLRKKRAKISQHIAPEKLSTMHAKGMLSARERIDALFDAGTFQEVGMHARHNAVHLACHGPVDLQARVAELAHAGKDEKAI